MNTGLLIVVLIMLFFLFGFQYHRIDAVHTEIKTTKLNHDLTVCVLADLHCRRFGKNQSRIINLIQKTQPDLIVIPGDLFDVDRDFEISFELIEQLKQYPIVFSSGNHDTYLDRISSLRKRLSDMGVYVLEHQSHVFDEVEVIGLTDMGHKATMSMTQFEIIAQTDLYRIVVSHRPDYLSFYEQIDCDLIICGHVHGGQWRTPFLKKGVYAPQRGLFPSYTEGLHQIGDHFMYISRGLASGNPYIPRLYNNPEVSFLHRKKE